MKSRPHRRSRARTGKVVKFRSRWRPSRNEILVFSGFYVAVMAIFVIVHFGFDELSGQGAVSQDSIIGQASVIDGDTIEIRDQRIRLHGIDAPESSQTCVIENREERCGQSAAFALSDMIGHQTLSCEPRDTDRYGRIVAVCSVNGEDLNAWMVTQGWAMAYRRYSHDYIRQEDSARLAKAGVWRGNFIPPWEWRQGERLNAQSEQPTADTSPGSGGKPSQECRIKGNISPNTGERIYHMPGDEHYEVTRINPTKGERWFCSESEAKAAGWRRAKS